MVSSAHISKKNHFTPQQEFELFHTILSNIAEQLLLIKKDGTIVLVNDEVCRAWGYSKEYLLGKKITQFYKNEISLEDWHKFYFSKLKKTRKPVHCLVLRKVRTGVRTMDVLIRYLKHQGQEYMLSTGRDVTDLKSFQLKEREDEKMQALQRFLVGMVHEIQNPLKSLKDVSSSLLNAYTQKGFEYIGYKEYNQVLKTLESMRDQSHYCHDTAKRLLNLKKKDVGLTKNHCQVNKIINDIVSMLEHNLDMSNIHLKLNLERNLPQAAIGPLEMNQILVNILTNAIQSMPAGGTITLKTSYIKNKKEICFECKDNGIGIPKKDLPRVFEPFFTTKNRGLEKSSGLGLSIVYSLIKSSNGEVTIDSDQRKGTLVKIFLPAYQK